MGILSKVGKFLTGGVAEAGLGVAGGIADIVERWKPSDGKKHEMAMEINKFVESSHADARKHDVPMNSGVAYVDAFVNGVNRLIRPWVTITVLGAIFGYWDLPPTDSIDPHYWPLATTVVAFWFGGRAVFKDMPQAIKTLRRWKTKEKE